jgi:hypothetical protein
MKKYLFLMAAVQSCIEANGWPSVPFQITKPQLGFGDYACNAAMLLGKHLKQNPMEIAEKIKEYLERDADFSEKVVVVKPGFINFWLDTDTLLEILVAAVEEGSSFCADFSILITGPSTRSATAGGFFESLIKRSINVSNFGSTTAFTFFTFSSFFNIFYKYTVRFLILIISCGFSVYRG